MSRLTQSERESLIEENWEWVVHHIDEKDADIERLNAHITALADALDSWRSYGLEGYQIELIEKARKATKRK